MKDIFCYCDKTETIRTLPSNYLVAYKRDQGWICDPDLAVPRKMSIACFTALLEHRNKYGTGLNLLAAITPTESEAV